MNSSSKFPTKFTNPWDEEVVSSGSTAPAPSALPVFNTAALTTANSLISKPPPAPSSKSSSSHLLTHKPTIADSWMNNLTQNHEPKAPLQSKIGPIKENIPVKSPTAATNNVSTTNRNIYEPSNISVYSSTNNTAAATTTTISQATNNGSSLLSSSNKPGNNLSMRGGGGPPPTSSTYRGGPTRSQSLGADPFDADWAAPLARTGQTPTNPFARQQTFQVSM
jgi:hypothetical protein